MTVEPGVTNLDITKRVAPYGYYYAPDPSSQQVCSIGGNVAENSGGAHCLKYGFTVHHVLGVEAVLPNGDLVHLGGTLADTPGPDLLGLVVGSEGTLAVVTSVTVRILRRPETVQTLLAAFDTIDAGGAVVSDIIGAGIIPAAVEMMDSLAIRAAEAAVHPNFPDADTVLIVELDGPAAEVRALFDSIESDVPAARRDDDRGRADRRAADADLARTQGGVRGDGTRLAELLRSGRRGPAHEITGGAEPDSRARSAIGAADRQRLSCRRRQPASVDLLRRARAGTSRHRRRGRRGNPVLLHRGRRLADRRARHRRRQVALHADDVQRGGSGADAAHPIRFDPQGLCNPGKVFPTPRLCGEVPGPYRAHPVETAGLAERM